MTPRRRERRSSLTKIESDGARKGGDAAATRIFRNAGALLGGKAAGGLLSLAYLAIAARALGPTEMGYLAIAGAYAFAAAGVARFQSWQAIIHFGTPMVESGDVGQLRTLLRFTVRLDFASAMVSVAVALAFVNPAAKALEWPSHAMPWIYLYCCAVPFLIAATPTGVLRLFDCFNLLGWQQLSTPSIRFVGALFAWATDSGLAVFLAVWIFSGVFDGAVLWWLGWRELKRRNIVPDIVDRPTAPAPRAWLGYMIKSNLAAIFDVARNGLPMLIIGATLGGAASGFLQLAVNMTNLIAHPANMLSQATLPELTKTAMIHGRRRMRDVAYKTMFISLAAATPPVLLFILLREQFVTIVGGPDYAPASPLLALMAIAQLLRISSIVFESASLGAGYVGSSLVAQGLSAAVQLASLLFLLSYIGVLAAPASLIIGFAVMIVTHRIRLHRT